MNAQEWSKQALAGMMARIQTRGLLGLFEEDSRDRLIGVIERQERAKRAARAPLTTGQKNARRDYTNKKIGNDAFLDLFAEKLSKKLVEMQKKEPKNDKTDLFGRPLD